MTDLHPSAATGFARAADAYERGRPGYPAAALEHVGEALGLAAGPTVVDVGAGTGRLAGALAAAGAAVIAVEPVAEMRAHIPAGITALHGTAEVLPVDAQSADAITVAQAFHWFDGQRALAEFHRVLRPGGRLALVWNRRVEDDPANRAIEALLAPHRTGTPTHRTDAWRGAFAATSLFGPLAERTFPNEQILDADGLEDRVGSISFIASLPEDARAGVLAAARGLAADGPVRVPYRTDVQISRRA